MNYRRTPIQAEIHEHAAGSILYNLAESSFTNFKLEDLGIPSLDLSNLLLGYGDHLGKKELREIVAKEAGVHPDEVLITSGAALGLFIVNTALLKAGDRIVGEYPNFVVNLETPRALGANIEYLTVKFEENFAPNLAEIEKVLETKTQILSLTVPHNPSGALISDDDMKSIAEITKKKGAYLLVDETYREFAYDNPPPVTATLGSHIISVCSMSKAFGLPGIRIGWIICRDPALMEKFLAAKEQIVICGSVLDEEVAYQFLKKKQEFIPKMKTTLDEKRNIVLEWFKQQGDYLEWVEPKMGAICLIRFKSTDADKINEFYRVLNKELKTLVGPGHWFEMEKRYMRLGFGWPSKEELSGGLDRISQALRKVFACL